MLFCSLYFALKKCWSGMAFLAQEQTLLYQRLKANNIHIMFFFSFFYVFQQIIIKCDFLCLLAKDTKGSWRLIASNCFVVEIRFSEEDDEDGENVCTSLEQPQPKPNHLYSSFIELDPHFHGGKKITFSSYSWYVDHFLSFAAKGS